MYLQNNNYLQNPHNTNQYYTNRHTTQLINYTSSDEHIKNKIFYYAIKNKLTIPNIKSIYIKRIRN